MSYPAFPTLTRKPALKTKAETIDPTLRDTMDNGMETTRAKFTRRRRQWDVTIEYLTDPDVAALDTFVQSVANYGASIFTFTDNRIKTNVKTYTVRFATLPKYEDADWVADQFRQNATFTLREV